MTSLLPFVLAIHGLLSWAGASPSRHLSNPGTFTINAARNPNYAPNGLAEYARALAKWEIKAPEGLFKFAVNKQSGSVGAESIADDREYLSTIGIGTPPQNLMLDLDTGSADFWVYSSETATVDLRNRTKWEPEKSSTALKVPNATWSIQYGDASFAYGNVWRDTVTIADISVPGAVVESAMDVSYQLSTDLDLCGIFGLAIGLDSRVVPLEPTVINTLKPLLDSKVFTTDLNWHAEGTYSFGSIDSARYTGDIHYVPLVDNAKYWQVDITGVHVDGDSFWYFSTWTAIADTGTSLLLLDTDIVKMYYDAIPTAIYKKAYDIWAYPCDTVLPDFQMAFGDYHITVPGRYINYTVVDGSTCMGGLQSNFGEGFSVLGDIFLKVVYAVFDYDGRRIGFADKVLD